MRTLIVSGGRIDRDFALSFLKQQSFERIIGVDNGLRFLFDSRIEPTHVVGDLTRRRRSWWIITAAGRISRCAPSIR